jgi:hypothetical protein
VRCAAGEEEEQCCAKGMGLAYVNNQVCPLTFFLNNKYKKALSQLEKKVWALNYNKKEASIRSLN